MIQSDPLERLPRLSLLASERDRSSEEGTLTDGAGASTVERVPGEKLPAVGKLYHSMTVVRMLLDHAAGRGRNQVATRVDRMVAILRGEGHHLLRSELDAAFQALEKSGVGRIVAGASASNDRFVWHIGMRELGRMIGNRTPAVRAAGLQSEDRRADGLLTHVFPLRTDVPVTLRLPPDISPVEVARLYAFLKTLPIEAPLEG